MSGAMQANDNTHDQEEHDAETLGQLNAVGIIGKGQSNAEFKVATSDVHRLAVAIPARKTEILDGAEEGDPEYNQRIAAFLHECVPMAIATLQTSEKLPTPLLDSIKWYTGLTRDQLLDLPQTAVFAEIMRDEMGRFESLFQLGDSLAATEIAYYCMLTSASSRDYDACGLNVALIGPPSSGKSYAMRACTAVLPPGTVRYSSTFHAKDLLREGCAKEMSVTVFDEIPDFLIGKDENSPREYEYAIRELMTTPFVRTLSIAVPQLDGTREKVEFGASGCPTLAGCYDGTMPGIHSALGHRWVGVAFPQRTAPFSSDQLVDPLLRDQMITTQQTISFYVQLFQVLTGIGLIDEIDMSAFDRYCSSTSHTAAYSPHQYKKMRAFARIMTYRYCVHMAIVSQGEHAPFFAQPEKFISMARQYMICTPEIAAFAIATAVEYFYNPV